MKSNSKVSITDSSLSISEKLIEPSTAAAPVKRYTVDYDCQIDPQCECSVEDSKQGEYVRYEDYEKSEALIKDIGELPDKWRLMNYKDFRCEPERQCANELQAKLKEHGYG